MCSRRTLRGQDQETEESTTPDTLTVLTCGKHEMIYYQLTILSPTRPVIVTRRRRRQRRREQRERARSTRTGTQCNDVHGPKTTQRQSTNTTRGGPQWAARLVRRRDGDAAVPIT